MKHPDQEPGGPLDPLRGHRAHMEMHAAVVAQMPKYRAIDPKAFALLESIEILVEQRHTDGALALIDALGSVIRKHNIEASK